jgi:flavin reductase (DIM6/NTAB) family NADH-FMN oxidoreductase RutF
MAGRGSFGTLFDDGTAIKKETSVIEQDHYFYQPATGHGLPHDPFKAIVAPRPIGWISSVDGAGRPNLAPYSFFNAMGDQPPIVAFSSSGYKDSVRNIEATGEFVANFATKPLAQAMNTTSAAVAHGVDEMTLAGLRAAPCRVVRVPRVALSPAALECRLTQVVRLRDVDGTTLDQYVVFGQVVGVHIAHAVLRDGLFDTLAAAPVMRAGYRNLYAEIGAIWEMERP